MTEPATLGAYLRAARRRRRVSIERAADDTRIRADFLMRMESDEFDFLAPAYVRSFLKTYARFLRLEPELILVEEFDRRYGGAKFETAQIAALERRAKARSQGQRKLNSWTTAAVLASLVLARSSRRSASRPGEDDDDADPGRTVAIGGRDPRGRRQLDAIDESVGRPPNQKRSIVAFDRRDRARGRRGEAPIAGSRSTQTATQLSITRRSRRATARRSAPKRRCTSGSAIPAGVESDRQRQEPRLTRRSGPDRLDPSRRRRVRLLGPR